MTGLDIEAARKVLLDSLPADPKWVVWVDGAVERLAGCVVEDPRLAQIRALCDDVTSDEFGFSEEETAGAERIAYEVCEVLDAAPVAATPPQGIDRDALTEALHEMVEAVDEVYEPWSMVRFEEFRDRILELVRPIEESGAPATVHGPSGAPSVATAHCSGGCSNPTAEGVVLRRCSWDECPGLEKSIPMHEQEDGPELHDVCKAAMIAPEAVAELTRLYQQLAQDRNDRPAEGTGLSAKEALLAAEALRFQAARTGHLRPTKAHAWRALATRLEAAQ